MPSVMSKRVIQPVEDERVILRLLEKRDLSTTLAWRNQAEIRKWFLSTNIIAEESHFAWFERYQQLDNDFIFVILAKDLGGIPVGQISLYGIDWQTGTAEYGRLMIGDPQAKGKGYAKQATQLVLRIGFEQLGLKEIYLEVKQDNAPAIAVYQSSGFIEKDKKDGLVTMSVKRLS
jgi:diamine N-acetyltransferase